MGFVGVYYEEKILKGKFTKPILEFEWNKEESYLFQFTYKHLRMLLYDIENSNQAAGTR